MSSVLQKTATCQCHKKVTLPPQGSGSVKHGCGRTIEFKDGIVVNIAQKAKSQSKK